MKAYTIITVLATIFAAILISYVVKVNANVQPRDIDAEIRHAQGL